MLGGGEAAVAAVVVVVAADRRSAGQQVRRRRWRTWRRRWRWRWRKCRQPGTYMVKLTVNGQSYTKPVEVLEDKGFRGR